MSTFQLDLTFFGLTVTNAGQVRLALFNQIHQIVFHGKGGYDWGTIYNMPRWLRQFTFNQINDFHKKENEANENASNGGSNKSTLMDPSGKISRENWNSVPKPVTPSGKSTKYK